MLYKHIIQVENQNVGLKVGGGGGTQTYHCPPIKKSGGLYDLAYPPPPPPPPPASYASDNIILQNANVLHPFFTVTFKELNCRQALFFPRESDTVRITRYASREQCSIRNGFYE